MRQSGPNEKLSYFGTSHRSYPPLAYPIFFPFGTTGWHFGMPVQEDVVGGPFICIAPYLRYYLVTRSGAQNYITMGRSLFQQKIVDDWSRAEEIRLRWAETHQKENKANNYHIVREAIRNNRINERLPKILPGSITGTNRWYKAHFKNAMALVREYGKPTFFITFTMDIGCDEVKSQLAQGQSSYDRPDLLNRVFEVKRKEFMKDVTERGIFGVCNAHVSSIEFQKRGAPHMHLIIWIENFSKTPSNIDNIICAEIPPKGRPGSQERRLYDLVMKNMIHGPCGSGQRQLSCCKKGKCSRKYPRTFTDTTEIKDDSFALYRRRDTSSGGNVGTKMYRDQEVHIKNQWVVPYSPYLLLKYASHVNVEYCHSIRLVKYLFKYQLKGEDMITVEGLTNEIAAYSQKRYISATLAHWRIAEFDIVQMKPSVTKLDVHLQDQQYVCYQPNPQSIVEALESAETTTLVGFFEANACPI